MGIAASTQRYQLQQYGQASHQSEDRQAVGLTIPPLLLARADEVIE